MKIQRHGDGKYRRITVYPPLGEPKTWHPPYRPFEAVSGKQISLVWEVMDDEGKPGDEILTLSINTETGTFLEIQKPKDEAVKDFVDVVEAARRGEDA